MTTQAEREALAQEAKRLSTQVANLAGGSPHAFRALTELDAAIDRLAAPPAGEQAQPVFWYADDGGSMLALFRTEQEWRDFCSGTEPLQAGPLYAAPAPAPSAQPMNFDQLQEVMAQHFGGRELTDEEADSAEAFARAIERAHGIGATHA